ncbi:MAG: rRNA maturation RNase YbeY [Gemmatimonadota bacterium]
MTDWQIEVAAEDDTFDATMLAKIEDAVRWTLARQRAGDVDLSVALVSDESISDINRRYLSHDGPTDVISFPLEQPGTRLVGDVYIGLQQAWRQAADLDVDPDEELLRLAIHGTLHVLGWNHPAEEGRSGSPMYRRQEELLRAFLTQS